MNARVPAESRPAGFWIRAVALLVDFLLFFAVGRSLGAIAGRVWGPGLEDSPLFGLVVVGFTAIFSGLYVIVLHAETGQTVGKMLVRVRVVDVDGGPLGVGAAVLRYVGYLVSAGTLGFGYVMAGLRRDKRALHDLIAGSRVERLPVRGRAAAPVSAEEATPSETG